MNEAVPDITHMLLLAGSVAMVTGIHVEETVTVRVKVAPVHAPETGVTI